MARAKRTWQDTLPRRIKVGGYRYQVTVMDLSEQKLCGQMNQTRETIEIDTALSGKMAVTTVIHEIMHAIWHNSLEGDAAIKQEGFCQLCDSNLMQVFMDNPKLLDWIKQTLAEDRSRRKGGRS